MRQQLTLLLECPLVIATILVCGIGGTFQYGYSVSVMTSPSEYIQELVNQTCLQRYKVSLDEKSISLIWSLIVSVFGIGGLVGSLLAGPLVSKFGRKRCLLINNSVAVIGALLMILSKTAKSFEMIMVGRFVYGFNAGIGIVVHSLYLLECSPKKLRGMVGVTIGTFLSFGKFSGQLLGIRELLGTEDRWPWLLGFNGFAALLQFSTLFFLPESPRFLLLDRGDRKACEEALRRLQGNKDYITEVEEMLEEKAALQNVQNQSLIELFRTRAVRWQLLTIIVTFITLQFCGINAVYFYSNEVFSAAGIPGHQLRYTALGTGLCETLTSLLCFMIVENTGKKVLLVGGYLSMSVTLILLTVTLYFQDLYFWMPYCSMVLVFIYIFFFAGGPAGVTAPLPGELYTQSFRSAAYSLAFTINWIGLFVLGMVFPIIVEHLNYFCFLIFLFFCAVCGLYVMFNVPETKNRTVLEITEEFKRMHSKSKEQRKKENAETKFSGIIECETKL